MVEIVVGGVHKCGTTALHAHLIRHPDVCGGIRKELHFFDREDVDWSNPDYSSYLSMFAYNNDRLRLDSTPSYIYLPHCLERIKRFNPKVHVILIFRDPIERAWSHWNMATHNSREVLSFEHAIAAEGHRLAALPPIEAKQIAYVDRGRYGSQLIRALNVFPRNQILCLESGNLKARPAAVLHQVSQFLGLSPFLDVRPVLANEGSRTGRSMSMTSETRQFIRETLIDDISLFAQLSGLDIQEWGILARG